MPLPQHKHLHPPEFSCKKSDQNHDPTSKQNKTEPRGCTESSETDGAMEVTEEINYVEPENSAKKNRHEKIKKIITLASGLKNASPKRKVADEDDQAGLC